MSYMLHALVLLQTRGSVLNRKLDVEGPETPRNQATMQPGAAAEIP
jgi:hypothetical protein